MENDNASRCMPDHRVWKFTSFHLCVESTKGKTEQEMLDFMLSLSHSKLMLTLLPPLKGFNYKIGRKRCHWICGRKRHATNCELE